MVICYSSSRKPINHPIRIAVNSINKWKKRVFHQSIQNCGFTASLALYKQGESHVLVHKNSPGIHLLSWHKSIALVLKNDLFFFFFCLLRATPTAQGRSQARGLNWSCSHWPTPQPQQCQIWAASLTYTTAHSNVGSLSHWVRPGIEPASSWILAKFVIAEPQWEPQKWPVFDNKWSSYLWISL